MAHSAFQGCAGQRMLFRQNTRKSNDLQDVSLQLLLVDFNLDLGRFSSFAIN